MSELYSLLLSAVTGTGGCAVIEGPPGIGKSRMLAAATDRGADLGMAVAAGTATEIDQSAPLSTLLTALQADPALAPRAADLAPAGGNALLLVDRIGDLLEDFSRTTPLVVALDDAHWADELTALALRILVSGLSSSAVLWLLARRSAPARRAAQHTIDQLIGQGAHRMPIGPLDEHAVAKLCADILGGMPDAGLLAQAARSGGNPFLVQELMRALRDCGQVTIIDGVASVETHQLPLTFLDAVDRRLRDLPDEARQLLDAGSILGRPFTLHEAAGLMGRSAIEMIPAANEAVQAGALVDEGSTLAYRHDLIREAVYDALSGPARLALHREAARVVRTEGGSPLEVAEHLIRGGRIGDEQALAVLREAVEQLSPTAPGTAADLILRMLELLDERDTSRPQLSALAVRLLSWAGRIDEAHQLGESALRAGLDAQSEAFLLLGLSEALKHAGQDDAVTEYTRRGLARPDLPDPVRAQLLAIQAHGLLASGDLDEADRVGAEAARIGAAAQEHTAVVFGTVARSSVCRSRGELDRAVAYARSAVRCAELGGPEAMQRSPGLWLARALVAVDRFAEADAVFESGQRQAEQLGIAWSHPLWHYYRAELRMAAGRLDDAQAEAEAGVRIAEQLNALALGVPLLAMLGYIALRHGELGAAQTHLGRAQQLVEHGVSDGSDDLVWRTALLQEAAGEPAVALKSLDAVYAALPERLQLLIQEPRAASRLVALAKRAGAWDKAASAAAAARLLADRNPGVDSLPAAALHAEGVLRGDLETLRAAAHRYRTSVRPLDRAAALEDTALAEDRAGHRQEAIRLLREAMDHYQAGRCVRDVARVHRLLRKRGVRRGGGRQTAKTSAWDTLTESELRVVKLVAEGLTNRQVANRLYLSPHTVDSHLRHSFTKLGVSSRVALTRYVLSRDRDPNMNHVST